MCGILAVFASQEDPGSFRKKLISLSSRLRHRGPDWSGVYNHRNNWISHERLAIVDLDNGAQPLFNGEECPFKGKIALGVNGEIYNYKALNASLKEKHTFSTNSDCEPIIHLYEEVGLETASKLDGIFSFVLYDGKTYYAARDPMGVTPLYIGYGRDGSVWFASEMKCLKDDCLKIEVFPPGHYYTPETGFVRYYNPQWWDPEFIATAPADYDKIRETFETSVVSQLMSDVPMGVLLSGGLDSSLVSAIVARHVKELQWPSLHSFSIGLRADTPDLKAARKVADFLKTHHHEYYFTVQDGLDALKSVIWHLESYDVTTIRASTPMYFLARKIKAMGVKMVLSGEGSDEIFGGYLYFHNAPSADEFHKECVRRVKNLHLSDCLRANKATQAWGVEARVPFLDLSFLEAAMMTRPEDKLCSKDKIEKYILRKAFERTEDPYLPEEILWRQKEQFSDGVGYSWIDGLIAYANEQVSDAEFSAAEYRFPYNTPTTKEAYYYRSLFYQLFPEPTCAMTVAPWVPTWGASKDPSGRAQKIHQATILEDGNNPDQEGSSAKKPKLDEQ
eukprot:TRINITY_DN11145_c0_g1_i1.p1 TRINITY_DN11145_c0_g1~~TRINITY_DN11145_c0_g1_i1.p1  ORF type:complete len:561 (+),score=121.04 TRINITY_DN11145_c0_g1_i1:54-1736(+)